jgi:CheY-like chemotaxis protein
MPTRKSILWVDDEIELLRAHVRFLETRGYDVTPVSNGDDAIQLLKEHPGAYDIVLLDKQMPVKTGFNTLVEMRALQPDLPVVMVTGYQYSGDIMSTKKIDGCLTKPLDHNQMLLVCKRIIDSRQPAPPADKFVNAYVRAYTENKARLAERLSASGWTALCGSLAKWDVLLDEAQSEGVRQMHTGLKSDGGRKFCDFVIENYSEWVNGRSKRPFMPVDITEKIVAPELSAGRSVLMVVLNGMRLDQFFCVEPELANQFSLSGTRSISMLPTTGGVGIASLVSGYYPDELSEAVPDIFNSDADIYSSDVMKRLMALGLARAGAGKVKTVYANAAGANAKRRMVSVAEAMKKAPAFGIVTLDIMDMFINGPAAKSDKASGRAALDEAALREQIRAWFAAAPVWDMMKEVCGDLCTVVLTSGHGHVLASRPVEIYEASKIGGGLRCMFSKQAAGDDRALLIINELSHFRLPRHAPQTMCLMAREDYFFVSAERLGRAKKTYPRAFRCGGISPEEMILPVYVCRPKQAAEE